MLSLFSHFPPTHMSQSQCISVCIAVSASLRHEISLCMNHLGSPLCFIRRWKIAIKYKWIEVSIIITLLAACSSLTSHFPDEKTNKMGNKAKCRDGDLFKGLRTVSKSWTTCVLAELRHFLGGVALQWSRMLWIVGGCSSWQTIQPDRLSIITHMRLGESFCVYGPIFRNWLLWFISLHKIILAVVMQGNPRGKER